MHTGYTFLLGWMLIQPASHSWLSPFVPQPLISASSCLCECHPCHEDWYDNDAKLLFLQRHQCNVEGNFIFLDSLESAKQMNMRWFGNAFAPVALALRPACAQRLDRTLERYRRENNAHNPAFCHTPLQAQSFTGNERLLGYEVLHYDWGWHSYLCSGLEHELFTRFNAKLTADGLIEDGDIAEQFAAYLQQHDLGEPGLRLAYALYA